MDNSTLAMDTIDVFVLMIKNFWWLFLLALLSSIPGKIVKGIRKNRKTSGLDYSNYFLQKSLITKNEFLFYKCLKVVVGDKFEIFSMVRLADIFSVKSGKKYYSYFQRITQKHVDFLLCDPKTMKPILGIELDDISHQKPNRKKRDHFVNNVFENSGLPLLHVKAKKSFEAADLARSIINILNKKTS